jgi:RHS repeat-associated protein
MKYNNTNNYGDIYNLALNATMPQLNFDYYEIDGGILLYSVNELEGNPADNDLFSQFNALIPQIPLVIPNMTTTLISSTLDNTEKGFYYNLYEATDNGDYTIRFRVIINVDNAQEGFRTPEESVSYNYDSIWSDQLESYDVISGGITKTSEIDYDNQGNPIEITNFYYDGLKRNHAILIWEGRQLVEIKIYTSSDESTLRANICYTYNDSGIRVSKVVDDIIYNSKDKKYIYSLSGDVLISEVVYKKEGLSWIEDYQIAYIYDYDGSLIGFKYYDPTGTENYLYIKNLQGDITKIVEEDGTIVVEYFYDAYGNIVNVEGSLSSTIGVYNSFRYRSYLYDNETNLYNIETRFYNPEIGRYLNVDENLGTISNVQSNNLYDYCLNNPVSSNSISLNFLKNQTNQKVDALITNRGYIDLGISNAYRTLLLSATDIALFGRYLLASGSKRYLVYQTEKSIMFPMLKGTYKASRLPVRYSQKVTGTMKNFIVQDASASTIEVLKRVGKTGLLFFAVHAGFNAINYDYDSFGDYLVDTVIDTAISLVAYYLAIAVVSLFVTGTLGVVAVIFVIGFSCLFDYGIREIFNYQE